MGKLRTVRAAMALFLALAGLTIGPRAMAVEKAYVTATIDVQGNVAMFSGQLVNSKKSPLAGQPISVRVDEKEQCAATTDAQGQFNCQAKDLPKGKHKAKVLFAGAAGLSGAESSGEFEITPENEADRTAMLKARAAEGDVYPGGRVTIVGTLATKKGAPIYSARVAASTDAAGASGSSLTDSNGGFSIPIAVPAGEAAMQLPVKVRFDGDGGQFPATETTIVVSVKPRPKATTAPPAAATTAPPAATENTVVQPPVLTRENPAANSSGGPSIVHMWPMLATAGAALALLGGLAFLAWRWHQRNQANAEEDGSLDDVAHFDDEDPYFESDAEPLPTHDAGVVNQVDDVEAAPTAFMPGAAATEPTVFMPAATPVEASAEDTAPTRVPESAPVDEDVPTPSEPAPIETPADKVESTDAVSAPPSATTDDVTPQASTAGTDVTPEAAEPTSTVDTPAAPQSIDAARHTDPAPVAPAQDAAASDAAAPNQPETPGTPPHEESPRA